jgi:hypothetical protein
MPRTSNRIADIRLRVNWSLLGCVFVPLLFLAGCHGPTPYLPTVWDPKEISPLVLEDSDEARMEIFIIYSSHMCSHTTLRIYSPSVGTVFWDPAGDYGTPEYPVVARRVNDLVVDPVPTVLDYVAFRKYAPTSRMEIFEFALSDEDAVRLIRILRSGFYPDGSRFMTRTQPFNCSSSISKFLEHYAKSIMDVKKEFFPHNLAKRLYAQPPDRVIIYDKNGISQYFP